MNPVATSIDIAPQARVREATASRAPHAIPLVSEKTPQSAQVIAAQINGKVHKHASNLRKMHGGIPALWLFEDHTVDESRIDPFLLCVPGSITRAPARASYVLSISFQQLPYDWHAEFAGSKKKDGLIRLGSGACQAFRSKLERLAAQDTTQAGEARVRSVRRMFRRLSVPSEVPPVNLVVRRSRLH